MKVLNKLLEIKIHYPGVGVECGLCWDIAILKDTTDSTKRQKGPNASNILVEFNI